MSWSCVSWDEVKDMTAILLAALAAVGLFTLLWLGLGRLLIPTHSVHLLLPVKGDGGDLEHNLKGLHWRVERLLRSESSLHLYEHRQ